jgi:hypothetical protein
LVVSVSGFDRTLDKFFQLTLDNFLAPRSTSLSTTFEFESYNPFGGMMDEQRKGIQIAPYEIDTLVSLKF